MMQLNSKKEDEFIFIKITKLKESIMLQIIDISH